MTRVQTGQSTPYHWISEDHGQFDTYHSLHPQAALSKKTDVGGQLYQDTWGNTVDWDPYEQQFKNYDNESAAPTTDPMELPMGATYDDYLFQLARREHPEYYNEDTQRWGPIQQENVIGRGFASPTDMTDFIYNNPNTDWR